MSYENIQRSRPRRNSNPRVPTAPVWSPREYPKHDPGLRMVCFYEIQGPEWLHSYQRWSLRVGGHFMDEPGDVSFFLNMGSGESPSAGKNGESKFYLAWTMANDGPPRRGQVMNPDIFLGKCFMARVEDSTHNSKGGRKNEDEVYSRITELFKRIGPDAPPDPLIMNHESINHESINQRNQLNQPNQGGHSRKPGKVPPSPGGV
jgi:hypothetical protein